jgi:hypothetical protein
MLEVTMLPPNATRLLGLVLICAHVGCVSQVGGREFDVADVRRVKTGMTSSEVIQVLGEPWSKTPVAEGIETWTYAYSKERWWSTGPAHPYPFPFYYFLPAPPSYAWHERWVDATLTNGIVTRCTFNEYHSVKGPTENKPLKTEPCAK